MTTQDPLDVFNKCQQCGETWIGFRRALCTTCSEKLGCTNKDCKSCSTCKRFLQGEGDGEFEPFLHEDKCAWYIPVATATISAN